MEDRSVRSKHGEGWFLQRAVRDSVPGLSPSFWWFAGWPSLVLRGLQMNHAHLCFIVTQPSLCVCLQICPFHKGSSHTGLGPTSMTSSQLNHIFIDPISKSGHILRCSRLGLHHVNFEGTNTTPVNQRKALEYRTPSSGPFGLPRNAQTLARVTQFHDKKAGSASWKQPPASATSSCQISWILQKQTPLIWYL